MGKLESELQSFSLFGKVVTTPSNNKPASTSLKTVSAFIPSSPEDMAKRRLVTQIIEFQAFDGSFLPHRPPVNKSSPSSLAELLGPGLQTLVEIMRDIAVTSIMLKLAEEVSWTVAIQSLLEIHFAAHRELWMLVHKKSSVFLYDLANPKRNPELPKKLLEVQELAKSSIEKARFYAFPSSMDESWRPLNWEKVLSERLTDQILIPLKLLPTKTDPLKMEVAQRLGRILPKDPLTDMIAMQKSSMFGEYARDSVVKGTFTPLKRLIMEYEEALERLSEKRKKGGSKKRRIAVQFSPCDAWVTTS